MDFPFSSQPFGILQLLSLREEGLVVVGGRAEGLGASEEL